MDGAADLLVEEDVLREGRHRVVEAERELPDPARALVEPDHLLQEIRAAGRLGRDHLAALEPEANVVDLACAEDGRVRESDLALNARLDRRREDLAVGKVLLALRADPRAAADV